MPAKVHVDLDRLPEFRLDRMTAEEVLISSARKMREKKNCARVIAYNKEEMQEYLKSCPFCRRNEENTPEETCRRERTVTIRLVGSPVSSRTGFPATPSKSRRR